MARQTFFSFHYERDAWRAGQVRNCNLLPTNDQHGFIDSVVLANRSSGRVMTPSSAGSTSNWTIPPFPFVLIGTEYGLPPVG